MKFQVSETTPRWVTYWCEIEAPTKEEAKLLLHQELLKGAELIIGEVIPEYEPIIIATEKKGTEENI